MGTGAGAVGTKPPEDSPFATPEGELHEATLHSVIGYRLAQATVAVTEPFSRSVGGPHDLRPVEYTVLCLIAHNAGTSPGRLASALALTKPNVTLWLDRLEARALVERRPNPNDGRALALYATAAGQRLAVRATQDLLEAERQKFDRLSAAEHAMLTELLHKLGTQR